MGLYAICSAISVTRKPDLKFQASLKRGRAQGHFTLLQFASVSSTGTIELRREKKIIIKLHPGTISSEPCGKVN